jgi:glycosyltransferase involved in cell wall biosynthesis
MSTDSLQVSGIETQPGGRPTRLLQIFSRYRDYGGEEGSVYRIGDLLSGEYDIGYLIYTAQELHAESPIDKGIGALKAFRNWSVLKELKKYQRLGNYDYWLVHNVFPAMSPAVYTLARKLGVKVIQYLHNYRMGCVNGFYLNHGQPCQRCAGGNFWPAFQTACWHGNRVQSGVMGSIVANARRKGMLDIPTYWIAISEAQKAEHVLMGIPKENITVIPHCYVPSIDPTPYPDRGDVLFLGRLSPEKGVDRLLESWQYAQDSGRNLWIVGDGPERQKLERMVERLSLKNVYFTGFLDHSKQREVWSKAACSIVPSIWKEPFGMVVLEAWAQERPVIANRIGGLPEIIDDGENGVLVPCDDPREMARAILRILDDPMKSKLMGTSGREILLRRFSPDVWLDNFKTLINPNSYS